MSFLLPGSRHIRVYTRSDWGARQLRAMADQPASPREAVLHHTGVPGGGYARLEDQKRTMRSIQNAHMEGDGWSDIGYHFVLFQPFGGIRYARIFEGRDWRKVPAAQGGHNTGTLAVCAVGNFERERLKRNMRYAIELLLRAHPAGRALATVGGHRDVNVTACRAIASTSGCRGSPTSPGWRCTGGEPGGR